MKRLSSLIRGDCPARTFRGWFLIGLVFFSCLAIIGCGGGGGSSDKNITVTVNPGEVTLAPGGTQQFSAAVTGTSNTAVIWSVDPQTTGGSITPTGLYTAPLTVGTYYVVATSQADPTKSGKAKVNVVIGGGGGGGHYYEGTITIERTGHCAGNNTTYNESATITNFKLSEGPSEEWGLTGTSRVTAYVADSMESGAHVDYGPSTKDSTKTTIHLSINSSSGTYQLIVVPWAEGAIMTPASGPAMPMDWPITVSPIQNQPLPANPSRITGSITDTELANCEVTWDLIKK